MSTKRKTRTKITETELTVSYMEVDFYRQKFAEWLTDKAGKEARSAFFALWAMDIFSRVNVSVLDKEVSRARRSLQRFLHSTYKPDKLNHE